MMRRKLLVLVSKVCGAAGMLGGAYLIYKSGEIDAHNAIIDSVQKEGNLTVHYNFCGEKTDVHMYKED